VIRIVVYGLPAPQGSKTAYVNKHTGRAQMKEASPRVKPWREAVKRAALDTLALDYPGHQRYDCPLVTSMVFCFDRPKGHYRTGRNAHLLRDSAPTHPAGTPDLSKLARSTEDALTDAGVWRDDARVVAYSRLEKV
jgi:Holliday junction resolvase RusA-like endonuclease